MGNNNPKSPVPKIRLEKKSGKSITVISGLHTYGEKKLNDMAQMLKSALGSGGTVKNGTIEMQGDKLEYIQMWFRQNK